MSLKINQSIFREYDIRGIAERDLSAEFAEVLGQAYALFISNLKPVNNRKYLTISVGRDCRLSGEKYANALIKGLLDGGLDVIRIGVCPSPLTYFSTYHLDLDGGIMVTGSHNPKDYNGFKICVGHSTIFGTDIQKLKDLMIQVSEGTAPKANRVGFLSEAPIIPAYIDHLVKIARPLKNKKIVLDAGNGTAATVAPILFERLGATVVPLFCELDGNFPNHHPDPTVPANLKDLVTKVLEVKADFGVAFDGDSDRIGLVDEKGRILYGDELMVIFSRDILKDNPGATIISEVKSSHRLYEDIARKGGNPIMWKTGHSLIKSKMKETGALLAGEMSGHIFFADRFFGFDDAIYAALRLFEIASVTPGPISSLISDLPITVTTPELRVECIEEHKFQLVHETKLALSTKYKINDIDGVRVDFGDGWGLLRASNTQPVLVLRFEAPNDTRLKEFRNIIEGALGEAALRLNHPKLHEADH